MNTTLKNLLLATSTAAILTACAGMPMGVGGLPGTGATVSLPGSNWTVQSINGVAVTSQMHPTLTFGTTMQLTGHTSCNTYISGYVTTGSMLIVKQGVSTKMACDKAVMDQETRFLKQLSATQMWSIDASGKLNLIGTSGTIVATRQ